MRFANQFSRRRHFAGSFSATRHGLYSCVLALSLPLNAGAICTPVEQWSWETTTQVPDYPIAASNVLVVQLTDDNGNGRVDANDVPDVVFAASKLVEVAPGVNAYEAIIVAVDGKTGSTLFSVGDKAGGVPVLPYSSAAGDIDGDGVAELLAIHANTRQLVAYDYTGVLKWVSDPIPVPAYFIGQFDRLAIADLDQDGAPEIFTGALVFDTNGKFLWQGTAGEGKGPSQAPWRITSAVDLDPASPGLELLAGNTLYAADGSILWTNSSLLDGWTAVADFTGDGKPDVVLLTATAAGAVPEEVRLLSSLDGSLLGPPHLMPPPAGKPMLQDTPFPPLVADIDGDGQPELVVKNSMEIQALKWSGGMFNIMWRQTVDEGPWTANGCAAFDFDGDGAAEIVDQVPGGWFIRDGRTGAVLSVLPLPQAISQSMMPVIADIDNDCRTEIVVVDYVNPYALNHVIAYECTEAGEVPARATWNQFQYHVTNVNDSGTIPRYEEPPWVGGKGWLAQEKRREQRALAEAGDDIRICGSGTAKLDATATLPGTCAAEVEYRWLDGAIVVCGWSSSPTCDVAPGTTTLYTLETRCFAAPACVAAIASDTVAVAVFPDVVPADLGNTLQAVKSGPANVVLSWNGVANAATYNVNRGTAKGVWPTPAFRPGLAGTTTTFADLAPPPDLYFYRVAGASCSGVEGP